ncbi:MAG: fibrobacter succinogenes major paralogous domain-containing protein [Crocinitomicaceae bacterium]|nr:fibrobacter succinogenes major paralogous domain-containing protein [Crocinitomicaceae bacterium]
MKKSILLVSILILNIFSVLAQKTKVGAGVTDVEGNNYKTIIIGKQEWMADNLKVTKYRNGQPIPHIDDSTVWSQWSAGAYAYYRHDVKHGVLYNWMTVNDVRKVCPVGWHVPSNKEWDTLANSLGGNEVAGGKLKSKLHWEAPNTGATNESDFHALPKGCYGINGSFNGIGKNAYWWTSTENGELSAWGREVGFNEAILYVGHGDKRDGLSIRCIKD